MNSITKLITLGSVLVVTILLSSAKAANDPALVESINQAHTAATAAIEGLTDSCADSHTCPKYTASATMDANTACQTTLDESGTIRNLGTCQAKKSQSSSGQDSSK
jgi:hypothetical protein